MNSHKKWLYRMGLLISVLVLSGCQTNTDSVQKESVNKEDNVTDKEVLTVSVDDNQVFQTVESIGASGSWWSQDIGGWEEAETSSLSKREYIAELLFDQTDGIGLSSYRYNLGGGSTLQNSPKITDPWRRAESFETEEGVYDWDKDANAQWFLNKAVDYGIADIYVFVNSPLTRLTKTGSAYGEMIKGISSNLAPENYEAFANYVYDVTEHFVEKGVPVTNVSPINEPQWEWTGGQEGNHYEPEEVVDLLKVFLDKKEERPLLENVHLSMPELGEWGNSSYPYYEALVNDETIKNAFETWDVHSYWTNQYAKEDFVKWLEEQNISPALKMSEWTEMVNGRDYTMHSALVMANQIYEDLTILDVTVWQYWIAVSSYDYRDGLIYVDVNSHEIEPTKRLWTMGNFSKFIRPGYVRIKSEVDDKDVNAVSFKGTNNNGEEEIVTILINNSFEEKHISISQEYTEAYITSPEKDLEKEDINGEIIIPAQSVVTVK